MSEITLIQKILADEDTFYLASIPNTVIEALKKRKRLPKKLYVHWRFFTKNSLYYAVTLGTSRDKNKNPLNENNITEIPPEIAEYIQWEEKHSHLEATTILWKITKWNGQTVALAKILFGYGHIIAETLQSYENVDTITITPEIKYYMELHGRTQLYWKHVAENTWLVSKDRKDYDAITWNTWDTIKLPLAVRKELGFFTSAKIEIEFSIKNDKPALIVRTKRNTLCIHDFLNDTLEENGKGIEIHELYAKYLEYLKAKHKQPYRDDFHSLVTTLEEFHIIPFKAWKQLTRNKQTPYIIPNYGLKTQTERGDDG